MDIFSIMPVEVFMDNRLSKNDFRVLGAILSFRNKSTNLCWPKREQISERCGLPITRISTVTSRLVALGWLEKVGNGGCSRSTKYALTVPKIEPKTVTKTVTVTEAVTVTKPVTKTVTEPVTRIKQTIEQTIEQTNKEEKGFSLPENVKPETWQEFEQHRKEIKKPLTDLARTKAANQIKDLTHEQQQAVVDYSITGRYPALYPEQIKTNKQKRFKKTDCRGRTAEELEREGNEWANGMTIEGEIVA